MRLTERRRGRRAPRGTDPDRFGQFLAWDCPRVVRVREELKHHQVFPWQQLVAR